MKSLVDGVEVVFAIVEGSDSGISRFDRMSKLLLEDGTSEDGVTFFGVVGGFLVCFFLLATLVNPSGSDFPPLSVDLGGAFKGQSQNRCPWAWHRLHLKGTCS